MVGSTGTSYLRSCGAVVMHGLRQKGVANAVVSFLIVQGCPLFMCYVREHGNHVLLN
jgi:hypothetical protein